VAVVSSMRTFRPLGGDGLDHWKRRVGFADARGMEPGEKAFGTGCTRASIAFRAAVGLLFAAPRTPGEDQWREWHGKRRERAIRP
jgi:hypothetical protein